MDFYVLTLFTKMIDDCMSHSVIGRAANEGIINIKTVDIRDFSNDKHRHVDDYPYGGGAGMVIKAQPVYDAYKSLNLNGNTRVVYMTPQGKPFNQEKAKELSKEKNIVIICGHYEGIDERVIEEIVTDELSLGDFVLTGGEIAAMAVIDSVSRLIPGVLGKEESFIDESFSNGFLEYPQYTRPIEFMGKKVPDILLSGNHKNIDNWRHEQSVIRTLKKREDIIKKLDLSENDKNIIKKYSLNSTDTNF